MGDPGWMGVGPQPPGYMDTKIGELMTTIYIKNECGELEEFEILSNGVCIRLDDQSRATHFFTGDGELVLLGSEHIRNASGCLYLLKHGKQHWFGDVLYERTGEKRCTVEAGESYLSYGCDEAMVVCRNHSYTSVSPVVILRVVR